MKRKLIPVASNLHKTTYIAVDEEAASEILQYLNQNGVDSEWKDIRELLKENLRNKDKYCKCDVSAKANNMYEMRFTRQGRNDRIYCQEFTANRIRYIVMTELYPGKKSQDIPKKIKSRIETMGGYQYEI